MFGCQNLTVFLFSKGISTSNFTIIHKKTFRDYVQTPLPVTPPPVSKIFSPVSSIPLLMLVIVPILQFQRGESEDMRSD